MMTHLVRNSCAIICIVFKRSLTFAEYHIRRNRIPIIHTAHDVVSGFTRRTVVVHMTHLFQYCLLSGSIHAHIGQLEQLLAMRHATRRAGTATAFVGRLLPFQTSEHVGLITLPAHVGHVVNRRCSCACLTTECRNAQSTALMAEPLVAIDCSGESTLQARPECTQRQWTMAPDVVQLGR